MDERLVPRRRQCIKPGLRIAGQVQGRLARCEIDHAHFMPAYAANAGTERLGAGLLRREALGIGAGSIRTGVGPGAFGLGETALFEALPIAFERRLDAPDVAKIIADADDHAACPRPLAIAAFTARMVSARPTKIASPMRKWPVLNSENSGTAASISEVS